jgi:hypothetical protein
MTRRIPEVLNEEEQEQLLGYSGVKIWVNFSQGIDLFMNQ